MLFCEVCRDLKVEAVSAYNMHVCDSRILLCPEHHTKFVRWIRENCLAGQIESLPIQGLRHV